MMYFFKHIFSFILPVTVLILVPLWIEDKYNSSYLPAFIPGILIICAGLIMIIASIRLFIKIGKGTLAPWSPTSHLVIAGPYRYVRNPMIIGVHIVLIGESLAFLSWNIAEWTILFFIINNIYFVLLEEPLLEKKFGKEYLDYKSHVRRWIPSLKPYKGFESS